MLKAIVARLRPVPSTANALGKLNKALVNLKVVAKHHQGQSDRKQTRASALQYEAVGHNAEAAKALRVHDKLQDLLS